MKKLSPLAGLIAVALAVAAPVATHAQMQRGGKAVKAPVVKAKSAVQKATVTIDGGYAPSSLSVKAGKPVEITFVRKSAAGCDDELVIPDLKFRKTLKQGEKAVVKFTPKKAGNVVFQCGMAMYKGRIVVRK